MSSSTTNPAPTEAEQPKFVNGHWHECALNHGGKECDGGGMCETLYAEHLEELDARDLSLEAIHEVTAATVKQMQEMSVEFDERCQERHDMGERKYGPGTWMGVDTLEMAIEEIIDLANYARFSYIKLRIAQEALKTDKSIAKAQPGNEMMSKDAFTSGIRGIL